MANNIAYTYTPKWKDPFTGKWETNYFVPAVIDQKGTDKNYCIITCSPEWNGVWEYDASLTKNYKTWMNQKKLCYYLPIKDCKCIKTLEQVENPEVIKTIKQFQKAWFKGEVKNGRAYKGQEPDWFLK